MHVQFVALISSTMTTVAACNRILSHLILYTRFLHLYYATYELDPFYAVLLLVYHHAIVDK